MPGIAHVDKLMRCPLMGWVSSQQIGSRERRRERLTSGHGPNRSPLSSPFPFTDRKVDTLLS